jgi:hypothetical protein
MKDLDTDKLNGNAWNTQYYLFMLIENEKWREKSKVIQLEYAQKDLHAFLTQKMPRKFLERLTLHEQDNFISVE